MFVFCVQSKRTHAHTHIHTHTHTRARARARTHTHTEKEREGEGVGGWETYNRFHFIQCFARVRVSLSVFSQFCVCLEKAL